MYTQKCLIDSLRALGVKATDVLAVHTSLKSVGALDAGEKKPAVFLIDALRSAVAEGLLLIPSFTYANIRETPLFDVRNTMPCIGGVPCAAVEMANAAWDRNDKTVLRSLQPSHSVVAFGKDAYSYVADDARAQTPFPAFGSYGKMMKNGSKILFLGAPLSSNSYIHAIDEALEPSGVHSPIDVTVIDYDGKSIPRRAARCQGPSAKYPLYEPYLKEAGALAYGKVGDADAILCDSLLCFEVVKKVRPVILGRS